MVMEQNLNKSLKNITEKNVSKFVCMNKGEKGLTAGMKSEKRSKREKMKGQKKERKEMK